MLKFVAATGERCDLCSLNPNRSQYLTPRVVMHFVVIRGKIPKANTSILYAIQHTCNKSSYNNITTT